MSQPTIGYVLTWNGTEGVYQLVGSPANASTTVTGITKLSCDPANPANPIAVGDNDPRLYPIQGVAPIYFTTVGTTRYISFKYKNEKGIIASGGGQGGATVLTGEFVAVDSVPNPLDGCLALAATGGVRMVIQNWDAVNDMRLYPRSGENFIGMAVDAPLLIGANSGQEIFCYDGEDGTFRFR